MVKLTIFTPTYNRAHTLPDLYNSLCKQTCQDFEWLVVDDGSTDGSDELVRAWVKEDKIDIRYFYQENAGKMMAHNRAVEEAKGQLFMCLDSDDYLCSERVVEDCLKFWEDNVHSDKEQDDICGFIAYKRFDAIKCLFPKDMKSCHLQELYDSGFKGETSLVLRRDILSRYPYPYYEGEKFVTDVFVYDQIDQEYRFLLFPYAVQQCRYYEDGYSNHYMELLFANPKGFRAYHNQCVRFRKKGYLKSVICYVALSQRIRDGKMLKEAASKSLTIMLFPLGILKFFYDEYRLSRI